MKIKQGEVVNVPNNERRFGSNSEYYAVHTKKNGKEVALLMSRSDFEHCAARAINNPEDIPKLKRGLIQRISRFFGWK